MIDLSMEESLLKHLYQIREALLDLRELSSTSLPSYTKPFTVESPIFIQQKCLNDQDVVNDTISVIYDIYIGFIITAVKLNEVLADGRLVRDVLTKVSSLESLNKAIESYIDIDTIIKDFSSLNTKPALEAESKLLDTNKVSNIISGKIIEISFSAGGKEKVTIPIFLKLNPRIVPDEIVEAVITVNIEPSLYKRWLQYKAGEIRFIKDFILQLDLTAKTKKALKHDKDNVLFDLLQKQRSGKTFLRKVFDIGSINIDNSIFIFDALDLKQASVKAGIDFDKFNDRQKFFNKAYAMMVVSMDYSYNTVDFYINSIKSKTEATFRQLNKKSKKDNLELTDIVKALQASAAIRF